MNDINPPDRRSIRNVTLSSRPSRKPAAAPEPVIITRRPEPVVEPQHTDLYEPAFTGTPERVRKGPRILVWVISIVCVVVLAGIVSSLFTSAAFNITLKPEPVSIPNLIITAAATQSTSTPLVYVEVSKPVTVSVSTTTAAAGGTETVNVKAKGRIVVFNKTTAAQALVKTTRFETPGGLIYRLDNDVTVPAKKGDTDGSVEVSVTADVAGDKYNIGMSDFTIPGFKGTPKYSSFYARSKTTMTGGFVGTRPKVASSTMAALEAQLREQAAAGAAGVDAADNLIVIAGVGTAALGTPQTTTSGEGAAATVTMTASGSTTYYALTKESVIQFITQNTSTSTAALAKKTLLDTSGLRGSRLVVKPDNTIEFTLSGQATLVTELDQAAFVQAVGGKTRSEVQEIVAQEFPNIGSLDIVLRPFWKRTVPTRTKLISVDVHTPSQVTLDSQ